MMDPRDARIINNFFESIRTAAHKGGFDRVEISIKADGRMQLDGYSARGFHTVKQLADLHPESCDPTLAEALPKFMSAIRRGAS